MRVKSIELKQGQRVLIATGCQSYERKFWATVEDLELYAVVHVRTDDGRRVECNLRSVRGTLTAHNIDRVWQM